MSKLYQLIKEGESLPLATASKAVFRYPFCGGIRNKSNRTQFRAHPRNAPVLSHGCTSRVSGDLIISMRQTERSDVFDFANAKPGGMNE